MILARHFLLCASLLALPLAGACYQDNAPNRPGERGDSFGKADHLGSCSAPGGSDFCGEFSTDGCYCDDECDDYGDCCGDKQEVCATEVECPQNCGEYCAMANDCALPDGCENPGCGCPIAVCETDCELGGGSCFGGTVNCENVQPGSDVSDLSCGAEGGDTGPQLTCCVPEPVESECEEAGGTCFGGFVNCAVVLPGTSNGELSCGADDAISPQLACCIPAPSN